MRLPLNCDAEYFASFISAEEASVLYHKLINVYNISTEFLRIELSNMTYISETGKINFMDNEMFERDALPEALWGKSAQWFSELSELKCKIEDHTQLEFKVCVCLYYPNGQVGVDYHHDPRAFGDTSVIPSFSLGAERKFLLRDKNSLEEFDIILNHGSVLIMGANCQERYEHSLPIDNSCHQGRINLTFRQFDG